MRAIELLHFRNKVKESRFSDKEIEKIFDNLIKGKTRTPDAINSNTKYLLATIKLYRPDLAKKINQALKERR